MDEWAGIVSALLDVGVPVEEIDPALRRVENGERIADIAEDLLALIPKPSLASELLVARASAEREKVMVRRG